MEKSRHKKSTYGPLTVYLASHSRKLFLQLFSIADSWLWPKQAIMKQECEENMRFFAAAILLSSFALADDFDDLGYEPFEGFEGATQAKCDGYAEGIRDGFDCDRDFRECEIIFDDDTPDEIVAEMSGEDETDLIPEVKISSNLSIYDALE